MRQPYAHFGWIKIPQMRGRLPVQESLLDPKGKKVFITGGTGRLGRALVEEALSQGAQVFFTYHQANSTARELERKGAYGFQSDFSDMRSIDRLSDALAERCRELHVLIHNAAATRDRLIRDMTEEDWDHVLCVDLKAPYYLTRKLLPLLRKASPAKIFMLTSRAAYSGGAGIANYAAAKAGLMALAKSFAHELGKEGVLVNIVNPGFMESRMTADVPEEIFARHVEASPLGRISEPEEVAKFICYLSSDEMSGVTGQIFNFESRKIPWQ